MNELKFILFQGVNWVDEIVIKKQRETIIYLYKKFIEG